MKTYKKAILSALSLLFISNIAIATPYEDLNNEEYCEEIYWEDYDNCVDWHSENIIKKISKKFCDSIIFDSTKKVCFKKLALKTKNNK